MLGNRQLRARRRRHQRPPARSASASIPTGSSSAPASSNAATPCRTRRPAICATRPPAAASSTAGVKPADIDLLRAGHLHAGHVVPLDRLPGAGPAEAELPGRGHAGGLRRLHVRPHHRGGLRRLRGQRPGPHHRRRLQLAHRQSRRHQDLSALRRRRRRGAADARPARPGHPQLQHGRRRLAAATC